MLCWVLRNLAVQVAVLWTLAAIGKWASQADRPWERSIRFLTWISVALGGATLLGVLSNAMLLYDLPRHPPMLPPSLRPLYAVWAENAYDFCLLVMSLWFISRERFFSVQELGLARTRVLPNCAAGVRIGMLVLLAALALVAVTGVPTYWLDAYSSFAFESTTNRPLLILVWFCFVGLLGPLGEELFFRGCVYTGLKAFSPPWVARWGNVMVWALIHGIGPINSIGINVVLGLLLTRLNEANRSLIPSMVAHAIINLSVGGLIWYAWFWKHGALTIPPQSLALYGGAAAFLVFLTASQLHARLQRAS